MRARGRERGDRVRVPRAEGELVGVDLAEFGS